MVSGFDFLSQEASFLINDYLHPHMDLKDTIHLLTVLEGLSVPTHTILASIDMEAHYSSIPYDKGVFRTSLFLFERDLDAIPYNDFITVFAVFYLYT